MTEPRYCRTADECDVHSRKARRIYLWTKRPGACAKVKRTTNRRERQEGKRDTTKRLREMP